ncbi:MAG: elongation factor Ts [Clostridiales bacterium]|nr:elongation factor Ts [Clostridiales bacterium]
MAYTAADVKTLREMTGVGMMDCKKALEASDGDMEKAVEFLREKGLAVAQKKSGRAATEGIAYAAVYDGIGVAVEVNAESDFVAANELFSEYVHSVAEVVAKDNPSDLDALYACKYPGSDKTVQEVQNDKIMVIGENIKIRRFTRYDSGVSVPYVHMGGKIGVIVNLDTSCAADNEVVIELGKDLAMQVAAMNPTFLDKADVDTATIEKEKQILTIQAKEDPKNANKPDNIIEKMVMGRISKYYKENCLLQQDYVKGEAGESVEKHVSDVAKAAGCTIKVVSFTRYEKGEGLEKATADLAADVAALVK